MADNVAITAGSGTAIAADDISSVWYQRVKLSLGADGTAVDAVAGAGNVGTGVQRVTLATDDAAIAALISAMSGGELTTSTHDLTASTELVQQALYAKASAPTDVSGDGDAVYAWALRNGAQVVNLSAAGALIPGDATNGLDVDVTRLPALAAGTNNIGDVDVLTLPALPAGTNTIGNVIPAGVEYETVAASQTAQALGATGATGDLINGILVIPATTSPGNVLLLDNATSITVFAGGASSVSNLVPFFIPLGIKSVSGAWKITTGTNVSCIGVGDFT